MARSIALEPQSSAAGSWPDYVKLQLLPSFSEMHSKRIKLLHPAVSGPDRETRSLHVNRPCRATCVTVTPSDPGLAGRGRQHK